jgi:A/G-specific adenine glycosylase
MAVLRETDGPVHLSRLETAWADRSQRERCLASLQADGLAETVGPGLWALPGHPATSAAPAR